MAKLTKDDILKAVEENYQQALKDSDYFKRLEGWLKQLCEENGI